MMQQVGLIITALATAAIFVGPALGAHGWLNIVHWAVGFGFGVLVVTRHD